MPLYSNLFKGQPRLEDCLVKDPAHVKTGDAGDHVRLIQIALKQIDGLVIDEQEVASSTYGPSTAKAVLAYKAKRSIINRSYQSKADDVVGKMTIASLDDDMRSMQYTPTLGRGKLCSHL